jgi:xanthine dehydrogenase accessory factor
MRDVLAALAAARARGGRAALATVVRTWQSAPRPPGAALVVTDTGEVAGSVSGGCVEGAVVTLGQEVIEDGRPRLETYGVSDDQAFAVGLTCGGIVEVLVERVDDATWPHLDGVVDRVRRDEPVAIATVVRGEGSVGRHLVVHADGTDGGLGSAGLDAAVGSDARTMLAAGTTGVRQYGADGDRTSTDVDVLVVSLVPPPRLLVLGATDLARALAGVGRLLGFRVAVCDARPVFATAMRFPDADEVVVDWPHRWLERLLAEGRIDERTAVAVLTHDPKFDVPALAVALRSPAGYVGALGSRRTHADRVVRLREAGLADDELARLHAPIGLDLGGRAPEETAVAIAAEIVQSRWGGSGARLTDADGPIHPDAPR